MTTGRDKTEESTWPSVREQHRIADLERQSLLAEQARQLAHAIRTPLSVVDLIGETLQLELQEHPEVVERLGRVLKASAKISAALSETLRSAPFPESCAQTVDAADLASRLMRQVGGDVEPGQLAAGADARVRIAPDALEAALVHALRLVTEGDRAPVLGLSRDGDLIVLRLLAKAASAVSDRPEREDRHLMRQTIERIARDAGGRASHGPGLVELRLPVAVDDGNRASEP
ncbi:hypothetical protein [Thiorhodococcus minor]|uniref:HAMP domain-containing histidine kinase n=1 Tax=Thiorhodococcus minor TaxID=57489 RepID=A0A6M0JWD6_9GAMM|nr:hypothetical protein [Thiorhodococcus minor]NEV61394.1 hypothetical protein [Thiorhodococcus minor]